MRIGLGIDALSPQLTGIGRYTWELCARLGQCTDISRIDYFRFGRWFDDPGHFLETSRPKPSLVPVALRRHFARSRFKRLLFHSPNYFLPAAAEGGVITVHDLSVCHFPEFHPAARVEQFKMHFGRSLAAAQHIITDSEFVRQELAQFSGIPASRITAVPLAVQPYFFRSIAPGDNERLDRYGLAGERYLLCVATLEPRKGLSQAITAFVALLEQYPSDLKLVIVGAKGWSNDALHARIARAEAGGHVRFLGYVPEEDLPIVYANAQLFLYPSSYEGFGLPPIEAMAAGVPVITSDRSCLPEVTGGAAMLIDPDDIDGFSAAIHRGLMDDRWRAQAIEAGRDVAASYSWERCIAQTVKVYSKVWTEYG